jgi:hypothetical protein
MAILMKMVILKEKQKAILMKMVILKEKQKATSIVKPIAI